MAKETKKEKKEVIKIRVCSHHIVINNAKVVIKIIHASQGTKKEKFFTKW
ncbi:MAG: hypothetical protein GXY94_04000 [Bacteroidales bacterium]|nr:hypothetical protein [Bacteroidales bacterium]